MASKTNSDKIDELEKLGAALTERLDTVRKEVAAVDDAHAETARVIADLRREYEREIALLKREVETRVTLLKSEHEREIEVLKT